MEVGNEHFVASRGRDIWIQRFDTPVMEQPVASPSHPGNSFSVAGKVTTKHCKKFLASEFQGHFGWKRLSKRTAGDAVERLFEDKSGAVVTVVEKSGVLTHTGLNLSGPQLGCGNTSVGVKSPASGIAPLR